MTLLRITLVTLAVACLACSGCRKKGTSPPPTTATAEPVATGACCIGLRCHVLTEDQCAEGYGEYFGDDTTCEGRSCAGACCMADGSCEDVASQGECELNKGGEWQGAGTSCAAANCPQPRRRPITPNADRGPITPNNPDRPR